jgi:hypothetical protein
MKLDLSMVSSSAPMRRAGLLLALTTLLGGCATTGHFTPGRGIYWNWTEADLQREGYPGREDNYSSREWGVLYDEAGIAYGPRSFYEGRTRLDNPHLMVTDEYLQSRWVRIYQSGCCTEALLGHYLEICDLAYHDLTEKLQFVPEEHLHIMPAKDLDEYQRWTGKEFWVTHVVQGGSIVMSPVDVLFRRTLAAHAAFAAVAEAILDLKCHGELPMWLREGLSSYLAEEGYEHLSFMEEFRARRPVLQTPEWTAQHVYPLMDREEGRIARYNAFLMVWTLSEDLGFHHIQELLGLVQKGMLFGDAVERVYHMSYEEWLHRLDPTVNGEPTTTIPPR